MRYCGRCKEYPRWFLLSTHLCSDWKLDIRGEIQSYVPNTQWTVQTVKCVGIQKETTIALDWNIILYYDISQVFIGGLPFHNRHLVTTHTVKGHVNSYWNQSILNAAPLVSSVSLPSSPPFALGHRVLSPHSSPFFPPLSFIAVAVSYRPSPVIAL